AFLCGAGHGQDLVWTHQLETAWGSLTDLASAGDVNGDGFDDLLISAAWNESDNPSYDHIGKAYVYSGKTGELLWSRTGERAWDLFGTSVCGLGDLDGDGHGDFLVGAEGFDCPGQSDTTCGAVFVYSGRTGQELWRASGEMTHDHLGDADAGIGDID